MVEKPRNHVTGYTHEDIQEVSSDFPDLTRAQVEWFQRNYPPRCYSFGSESLEAHIKYSGKAELGLLFAQLWENRKLESDVEIASHQP